MDRATNDVWITGIGLVSSLGDGVDEHWLRLADGPARGPVVDGSAYAPYPVHPLVELDYAKQIPRRGDQRQMGPWQLLGTYAAGQALDDAGIGGNQDLLDRTNMIVAAGGGERDVEVDESILEAIANESNPQAYLNTALMNELRPTLFLAQLPNLLAGNISIVHKVTGSSRTFMGEEPAGVSAVEVAHRRIQSGQGELFLVGGANSAERKDLLLLYELGHKLWGREFEPIWARSRLGGGVVTGSVGAFLVIESRRHAETRGAKPYARVANVASTRTGRSPGETSPGVDQRFAALVEEIGSGPLAVLSGASGAEPATRDERQLLDGLEHNGADNAVRAVGTMLGHSLEAQFPAGLCLAAMALSKGAFYQPFDQTGFEKSYTGNAERVLVTCWGHWHGKGLGVLERVEQSRL